MTRILSVANAAATETAPAVVSARKKIIFQGLAVIPVQKPPKECKMNEFEFLVRIAGKDKTVRMTVSPSGAQACDTENFMRVMGGGEAVAAAYKVSKANGDKAENLKRKFDYASWEMRDCR